MKIRISIVVAVFTLLAASPVFVGCGTPPSARVVQVQSLKAVGHSAEAAVSLAANLYGAGRITAPQAKQVMDFYDQRFQPAFRLAVAAVNANLDSAASPDLVALATQLSTLVASFGKASP